MDSILKNTTNYNIKIDFDNLFIMPKNTEKSDFLKNMDSNLYNKIINYKKPTLDLLQSGKKNNISDLQNAVNRLQNILNIFKIKASVINYIISPNVITFFLKLEEGEKINKIKRLQNEIALILGSKNININLIPEKNQLAIEIENPNRQTVFLKDILQNDKMQGLNIAIGVDTYNKPIYYNIEEFPHLLIAGCTGSGKSVFINNILINLLLKNNPNELKLILIDPKIVELSTYEGLPHLLTPIINDIQKMQLAFDFLINEMESRYKILAKNQVRNINEFNKKSIDKMSKIIVVVDELADFMLQSPKSIESKICRLAQKARACGIYLILATQRPSVDVITGLIKANIPSRIAFTTASIFDSRTILDFGGAEKLQNKGDSLFLPIGSLEPVRVQTPYVSTEEVQKIINFIEVRDKKWVLL
jgi:S-DNA-T family DNA segregation ATPase FtsK/SpoIIIE